MPRDRRFRKRRPVGKRKYGGVRRKLTRRVKITHHFKEICQLSQITAAGTATTSGVISWNLNQLTNNASFKNLFDLYKITGVKLKMLYRHNVSDSGEPAGIGEIPVMYMAPNRDPFVPPPTTVGDILNDDGVKIFRCDAFKGKGGLYLKSPKPDMSSAVTVGGVPSGGLVTTQWNYGTGSKFQPWLTTGGNGQALDQSGVSHYGYRYFFDNSQSTQTQTVYVYATLYFSMKEQD